MWLTNFNLHKCKVLSFGIQVNIKNIAIFYVMHCMMKIISWMESKRRMNNLGVLFS